MGTSNTGIKIAISGKGGVGKTTLSSLLAHLYAQEGYKVLAVDADPDANLGLALGFSKSTIDNLITISKDKKLIKERTGAEPGTSGQFFSLNPKVEDIPQRYVVEEYGIKLMELGGVDRGGGGCICPESALIKHLLRHLVLHENETLIVDMEAGLEHMGRGTGDGVDAFIVVVEPGKRSLQTAHNVVKLAEELGVQKTYAVVNKMHPGLEEEVAKELDPIPVLGYLPFASELITSDLHGDSAFHKGILAAEVKEIKNKIEEKLR
ncbi:CO dehydrogenase maturation factor [Desulfitispora alkaliphila]|uniref:ATP-binding protein n=1 Tax=Desulfitispora alkaliphila TaxID=622674 RepID=UPI003D1E756E